jgi:hypothetical protein
MRMVPWSRWCVLLGVASLLFGLAPHVSHAQSKRSTGARESCVVMAEADPLDLIRVAQATQAPGQTEPVPGRVGPITKEEVGFLIQDLQRVPLGAGGWTIRAAKEGGRLPTERLRQLVGDVRSVLAVQQGRDVLALMRRRPGVSPSDLQDLERSVEDIARCTLDRIGGESVYQQTLQIIRDRRPEVEAALLEPFTPAAKRSR